MNAATIKPISKAAQARIDKDEAVERLTALFAGDEKPVVSTILRHVSASGMSRDISLYYKDINITYSVAMALGDKVKSSHGFNAIRVQGCGMDMGFHLVYSLSCVLYGHDDRGGYRLSHCWL